MRFIMKKIKIFQSIGPTKIITSENYIIDGENIILDNSKKELILKVKLFLKIKMEIRSI